MKTHQIIAVVIEVSLVKNEIISVNVNKTKNDVFIAVILRCSRWDLMIFIRCLYNILYFKTFTKLKKHVKSVKDVTGIYTSIV